MALLRHRRLVPELMDDPSLDAAQHRRALAALARLNAMSQADEPIWRAIAPLLAERPLTLLDVATGSADVPLRLALRARRVGLDLRIAGCDASPVAIESARSRADAAGLDAQFFTLDAIRGELPSEYDVITTSLFIHHLTEAEAGVLLAHMREAARALVVASDLRRTALGLALAGAAGYLVTRSHVVHADAVRSARAALTIEELRAVADAAGLTGADIQPTWPSRMCLTWRRPP